MCRVSPSFLRVGHLELFFRRAVAGEGIGELQKMCEHVLHREFLEIWEDEGSPTLAAKLVLMVWFWIMLFLCQLSIQNIYNLLHLALVHMLFCALSIQNI